MWPLQSSIGTNLLINQMSIRFHIFDTIFKGEVHVEDEQRRAAAAEASSRLEGGGGARGVMRPSRAWMVGVRRRTHLAWLGSQHRRLHREEADGDSIFPEPKVAQGSARNMALLPAFPSAPVPQKDFGTLPLAKRNLPVLGSPSLGTTLIAPVVGSLPSRCKRTGLPLLKNAGSHTLGSQMKPTFCTLAGDQSATNAGDDSDSKFQRGNVEALVKRIAADTSYTTTKVHDFEARYNNYVRPLLVWRCLVTPCRINEPWMVFLHRQTFAIFGHNPCYLSCFDIMAYEHGSTDGEWEMFLNHLLNRKVYIIEDWDSSYSTIEILMYDYGLQQPDDGTGEPFFKGECDASYDEATRTASFSYIIWKNDKIVYSEVFSGLECSSAVEAEIHAAHALLYKAEQLKIRKLLLWTDSRTVARVLTGEHPITRDDDHRDSYITLRAMRKRFSWLVAVWKPRELMFFADDLANLAKLPDSDLSSAVKLALEKWSSHLQGLPVFRIEWTKVTKTAVKKFKKVILDDKTYGMKGPDVYFVEVEEDCKLDCLVALTQTFKPSQLTVALDSYDDKCDSFKEKLGTVVLKKSRKDFRVGPIPGKCNTFSSESLPPGSTPDACNTSTSKSVNESPPSKDLVVVLDYSVPRDVYHDSGAFHVVLVTPSERESMIEEMPELTALGFVYFNNVRFPLNEDKEKEKAQKGQK